MNCPFVKVGNTFINFNNVDNFIIHYKEPVYKRYSDHPIYSDSDHPYIIEITNISDNTSYYRLTCEEYEVFNNQIQRIITK